VNVTAEHQQSEARADGDGGLLAAGVGSPRGVLADKGRDGCRGEQRPVGWLRAKTGPSDPVAITLAGAQSSACHGLKMGVIGASPLLERWGRTCVLRWVCDAVLVEAADEVA
jgi:hypothetical protein